MNDALQQRLVWAGFRALGVLDPVPQHVIFHLQQGFQVGPRAIHQFGFVFEQEFFQQDIKFFHATAA